MIRWWPNKIQNMILNNQFGTAGWTYNQIVALICRGTPTFVKGRSVVLINTANIKDNLWAKLLTTLEMKR